MEKAKITTFKPLAIKVPSPVNFTRTVLLVLCVDGTRYDKQAFTHWLKLSCIPLVLFGVLVMSIWELISRINFCTYELFGSWRFTILSSWYAVFEIPYLSLTRSVEKSVFFSESSSTFRFLHPTFLFH